MEVGSRSFWSLCIRRRSIFDRRRGLPVHGRVIADRIPMLTGYISMTAASPCCCSGEWRRRPSHHRHRRRRLTKSTNEKIYNGRKTCLTTFTAPLKSEDPDVGCGVCRVRRCRADKSSGVDFSRQREHHRRYGLYSPNDELNPISPSPMSLPLAPRLHTASGPKGLLGSATDGTRVARP